MGTRQSPHRATLWAFIAIATAATVCWAADQIMVVKVEEATLRSSPSFLGKPLGTLRYEDAVTVTESNETWSKVTRSSDGVSGWVRTSALITDGTRLQASGKHVDRKASAEEMALAGRGLNAEIEREHRKGNPTLDYSYIDTVEADYEVSPAEAVRFLHAGGLIPEGGAR